MTGFESGVCLLRLYSGRVAQSLSGVGHLRCGWRVNKMALVHPGDGDHTVTSEPCGRGASSHPTGMRGAVCRRHRGRTRSHARCGRQPTRSKIPPPGFLGSVPGGRTGEVELLVSRLLPYKDCAAVRRRTVNAWDGTVGAFFLPPRQIAQESRGTRFGGWPTRRVLLPCRPRLEASRRVGFPGGDDG